MANIYHQVGVKVGIHNVYDAITTLPGLSSWWSRTTGNTEINGKLYFHFGDIQMEMTILELVPDKKVVWQCTEQEGEWKDTIITFDLVETNEQVFINFSHKNWAHQTNLCSHCSTKWAVFMLSLKDYLEKGKGQPFPNDVQVNHSDY